MKTVTVQYFSVCPSVDDRRLSVMLCDEKRWPNRPHGIVVVTASFVSPHYEGGKLKVEIGGTSKRAFLLKMRKERR